MHLIAGILLAVGAIISVGNLAVIISFAVKRRRGSLVPFIGGLLVLIGGVLGPGWRCGLIGIVVDPGCAFLAACMLNDRRSTSNSSGNPDQR